MAIGKEHVQGAGNTDIAVAREGGFSAAIELKWWSDPSNQVDDALWDAVKVATFVREDVADAGYLIAAGSDSTWDSEMRLLMFCQRGEWPLAEIRQGQTYFQNMFSASKGPLTLPIGLRTEPAGEPVAIQTETGPWSLRCCRVWPLP
ncbi:MAG: hypothetical protein QOH00_46 [Gaiellales bacterium]|nr:hypothetical protein [Gaiellales bacterium]